MYGHMDNNKWKTGTPRLQTAGLYGGAFALGALVWVLSFIRNKRGSI